MRLLFFFLAVAMAAGASAQSQQVLRAQSIYALDQNNNWQLDDTQTHVHLNGRNSKITVPVTYVFYPYNGIYNADTTYGDGYRRYQKFNAQGLVTEYVHQSTSPPAPATVIHTTYVYNSSQLPDSITEWYPVTTSGMRHVYAYNNGKVAEILHYWWGQGQSNWQATPTKDVFSVGAPGSDSTITRYNMNGIEDSRNQYKRDAANRILSDSAFNNGSFIGAHYYSYDAQGRMTTDSTTGTRDDYRYDALSQLVSIAHKYINQGVVTSTYIDSFTYNNSHQITSNTSYDSTATNSRELTFIQRFYYDAPASVAEVAATNSLQLYPMPATTYININMSFIKPQAFSVRIFDMQGRLVSQWQEGAQKTYNKQIPLTGMAPGQYMLQIFAGSESASRQFMVVR